MPLKYKTLNSDTPPLVMINLSLPLDTIVSVMKASEIELNTDFKTQSYYVLYEESEKVTLKGGQSVDGVTSNTATVLTNTSQNIFDFILNTGGDLNTIVKQLKDNEYYFLSMNAVVDGVLTINYSKSYITDYSFKLASKNINYSTGDSISGASFDFGFDYSFDS